MVRCQIIPPSSSLSSLHRRESLSPLLPLNHFPSHLILHFRPHSGIHFKTPPPFLHSLAMFPQPYLCYSSESLQHLGNNFRPPPSPPLTVSLLSFPRLAPSQHWMAVLMGLNIMCFLLLLLLRPTKQWSPFRAQFHICKGIRVENSTQRANGERRRRRLLILLLHGTTAVSAQLLLLLLLETHAELEIPLAELLIF